MKSAPDVPIIVTWSSEIFDTNQPSLFQGGRMTVEETAGKLGGYTIRQWAAAFLDMAKGQSSLCIMYYTDLPRERCEVLASMASKAEELLGSRELEEPKPSDTESVRERLAKAQRIANLISSKTVDRGTVDLGRVLREVKEEIEGKE